MSTSSDINSGHIFIAYMYRVVQLTFTPEIKVFHMLFEISLSIFSMTSLKQHIEYFNFRCKIKLDLPVHSSAVMVSVRKYTQPGPWIISEDRKGIISM